MPQKRAKTAKTPKRRETPYARELATAKLPSGTDGKAFVAIERIHVKQADQVEIRFSWWQGARMMPRPLDLPEEELLPLLKAAVDAGVFSDEFLTGLRRVLGAPTASPGKPAATPANDLEKVQAHFHELIRTRAGHALGTQAESLPRLAREQGTEEEPVWFAVDGMHGGFKYWWDVSSPGLRLMSESWSRVAAGSGQLHEITPSGARLLGEGFV
jgi:hypothetical protein